MADLTLLHGDCLDLLPSLAAGSIDLILADLPYGTTQASWDSIIPLDKLWPEYKRVLKPAGMVVLTAAQPFTSALVMSNPAWFRYVWTWDKRSPVGHLNAKKMPLQQHEDVCVFSPVALGNSTYHPQMQTGAVHKRGAGARSCKGGYGAHGSTTYLSDEYYPTSILSIPRQIGTQHPNEKPTALMEYLIRTYSNPGDLVLDNTMGSGTTGEACLTTGRRFIGMERDATYYHIAVDRLAAAQARQEAA